VTQLLKSPSGQFFEPPGEVSQADPLPERIRQGVDRAFSTKAAQCEALVRLLADEAGTEALRRRTAALQADAAELRRQLANQRYGVQSRESLSDPVFGKPVRGKFQGSERYSRTVGRVYTGAQNVNAEMVRRNVVWLYRSYSTDPALLWFERTARTGREAYGR
jgi:hypothetical protein